MSRLSLRAQVLSLLILFGALFAGFIALVWSSTAERVEDSVYADVLTTKDLVADVLPPPLFIVEAWLLAHQAVLTQDPARLSALEAQWGQLEASFQAREQFWPSHLQDQDLKRLLLTEAVVSGRQFFELGRASLFALVRAGKRAEAEALLLGRLASLYADHQAAITHTVERAAVVEQQQRQTAAAKVVSLKWTLLGAGLVGLVLALVFGLRIAAHLSARLDGLVRSLEDAATGDLRPRPADSARDEVTRVHEALRSTLARVAEALTGVQRVSAVVLTESTALTGTSQSLTAGVSEQAASSEETSATLEELTANSRQTADIAQKANALTEQSRAAVDSSQTVMRSTQEAMRTLAATSGQVQDIVGTVDEMAFQTNLLALNAAVEAARAGEAGRGFGVVAHEVRALAQRSAQAAKDIRRLLQGSADQVNGSTQLVDACSAELGRAGASVAEMASLMGRLASAANEQSAGISEISRASVSSDSVAQRTAGQAQALADAARRLGSSASHLSTLTARFETGASNDDGEHFEAALTDFGAQPAAAGRARREAPQAHHAEGRFARGA